MQDAQLPCEATHHLPRMPRRAGSDPSGTPLARVRYRVFEINLILLAHQSLIILVELAVLMV